MMGLPFGRFGRREVSIEPLNAQDSHAIQRIHAAAFHHGWSSDDFRSLIGENTVFGFVARAEGKPNDACGFVLARLVAGEAEILTIAVARDVQRQGVGARSWMPCCAISTRNGPKRFFSRWTRPMSPRRRFTAVSASGKSATVRPITKRRMGVRRPSSCGVT